MDRFNLEKYRSAMDEIVRLLETANREMLSTTSPELKIKSAALCLRNALEQIAMSSLITNQHVYSHISSSFRKEWNAKTILKNISEINPDYYPYPLIVNTTESQNDVTKSIGVKSDGYLRKENFPDVYNRCSAVVHTTNPFGKPIDVEFYETNIPIWIKEIAGLIECHMVTPINSDYPAYVYQVACIGPDTYSSELLIISTSKDNAYTPEQKYRPFAVPQERRGPGRSKSQDKTRRKQ